MGKTARKNVKEYAEMAKNALAQGTGSSWKNLDLLIEELCESREPNGVNKLPNDEMEIKDPITESVRTNLNQ